MRVRILKSIYIYLLFLNDFSVYYDNISLDIVNAANLATYDIASQIYLRCHNKIA